MFSHQCSAILLWLFVMGLSYRFVFQSKSVILTSLFPLIRIVSENSAIAASKKAYLDTLAPFKEKGKLDNNPAIVSQVNDITQRLIKQAMEKWRSTQGLF